MILTTLLVALVVAVLLRGGALFYGYRARLEGSLIGPAASGSWVCASLCVLLPLAAEAQGPPSRGWVDVNFGIATSAADDEAFAFEGILFQEPFALAAAYPKPSRGASFDVGGGFMFTPLVGIGVSVTGTAHEDIVGLGAVVPHPFFFDAEATASGFTDDKLTRTEGTIHLQAMLAPLHTDKLRVRVFGGPSYFRYKADMVRDITFTQVATLFSRANVVDITGFEFVETEGTAWGFHAGGDVSYFFSRIVGVGAGAKFSRGTVTIDEPMSEGEQDVKVGGLQLGGGLRLRF